MSRPKPNVLLKHTDPKSYKVEEVLEAEALYAVFYNGKPFNLKSENSLTDYPGPKYKKTCFLNIGHALNLAKRLNNTHRTDKFEVYKITSGEKIPLD